MKRRSPLVVRSRYIDEWNLNPRFHAHVHKNLQDDFFDKVPKWEGIGKHRNDYGYATNVFNKWLKTHINKPWTEVQKLLKERLPDPHEYDIACKEVQKAIVGPNGEVLVNMYKGWSTYFVPLERLYQTPFYYIDLKGILRDHIKPKTSKRPAKIQMVADDGYYWFKRKGLVFKAEVDKALYEKHYKTWRHFKPDCYNSYSDIIFYDRSKSSWMKIKASEVKQASHKDIIRHDDAIKKITHDLTIGTPELDK